MPLEALFSAIAEAVFGYLLQQSGLAERARAVLGLDPERRAFLTALAGAYAAFARRYPEWTVSLFDETFLKSEAVIPLLAELLTRRGQPDPAELARRFAAHLGQRDPDRCELSAEQKAQNRAISQERLGVEHSIGKVNIFRIVRESCRNHRPALDDGIASSPSNSGLFPMNFNELELCRLSLPKKSKPLLPILLRSKRVRNWQMFHGGSAWEPTKRPCGGNAKGVPKSRTKSGSIY